MAIEYINTNIRYIEPVYERRLEQTFEVGDVVMIGPAYTTSIHGVDRYVGDEVTGLITKIDAVFHSVNGSDIFTICLGGERYANVYANRLILIRSK